MIPQLGIRSWPPPLKKDKSMVSKVNKCKFLSVNALEAFPEPYAFDNKPTFCNYHCRPWRELIQICVICVKKLLCAYVPWDKMR